MKPVPVLAIELDAGPDQAGRSRHIYVMLDDRAKPVDVVESGTLEGAGYPAVPAFGPLDVKPGVYREMLRIKKLGTPEVSHRRSGRWVAGAPLRATIGERSPHQLKNKLLRGAGRRK